MSDNPTTETGESRVRRTGQAARSGLDVMLSEAAAGGPPRFIAPGSAVKVSAGLARHPGRVIARAAGLGAELARTAAGRSELAPAKGDRRFADPRVGGQLAPAADAPGLPGGRRDRRRPDLRRRRRLARRAPGAAGGRERARRARADELPVVEPDGDQRDVDTGGGNLVRGARRLVRDLSTPPRLPATVDTSKFEVGGNLAASPGSVVLRTDVFELIQYKPTTEQVREMPLLFVPPTINKFYVLDLAPGRSMIEYYVAQGQQVFVISWRNPEQAQGHFDLDTYARGGRRGPRRGRLDHRQSRGPPRRPRARAGSSPPDCSGTSPPAASWTRSRA